MLAELEALDRMRDDEIDFSDIPECLDFSGFVRGKFYRPLKKPISFRIDADILAWFKDHGKKYHSRMNEALREYMQKHKIAKKRKVKPNRVAENSGR